MCANLLHLQPRTVAGKCIHSFSSRSNNLSRCPVLCVVSTVLVVVLHDGAARHGDDSMSFKRGVQARGAAAQDGATGGLEQSRDRLRSELPQAPTVHTTGQGSSHSAAPETEKAGASRISWPLLNSTTAALESLMHSS
jgi:hypothetical protein